MTIRPSQRGSLEQSIRNLGGAWDTTRGLTVLRDAGYDPSEKYVRDVYRGLVAAGLLTKTRARPVQYRARAAASGAEVRPALEAPPKKPGAIAAAVQSVLAGQAFARLMVPNGAILQPFLDSHLPKRRILNSILQTQRTTKAFTPPSLVAGAFPPPSFLASIDLTRMLPGFGLRRTEAFDFARALGSRFPFTYIDDYPSNWSGVDMDYEAMLTVMEEGIPLVWVPSHSVISALVAEPDQAARRKTLEGVASTVIDDCGRALEEVQREDVTSQVGYLQDCLCLLEQGMAPAAQALAASVWDTTLRAIVRADTNLQNKKGHFQYPTVIAGMPKATMETEVGQFRAFCIHTSVHAACTEYYGPPVPETYSRHATSHAAGPTQYNLSNALTAVMLAVSLLRELEETGREITPAD